MPAPGIMQSEFIINGSFGELYDQDGSYIANIQRIEWSIRHQRRDVMRAGTRATAYKAMTTMGEGTIGIVKTNSYWDQIVSELMRTQRQLQRQLQLRVKLDDPEALGVEEYRLMGVKLWEINGGFNVNDVIEQNIPFTFERFEPITWIRTDANAMLASLHAARYVPLD